MFLQYFNSDPNIILPDNIKFTGCENKNDIDNYQKSGGVSKIIMNMIDYLLKA
jgi:hypothetical protein